MSTVPGAASRRPEIAQHNSASVERAGLATARARHLTRRSCVGAQERLVELLRVIEHRRADAIRGPLDGPAIRVHLVGGVAAERLEAIAGRVEEVDGRSAR